MKLIPLLTSGLLLIACTSQKNQSADFAKKIIEYSQLNSRNFSELKLDGNFSENFGGTVGLAKIENNRNVIEKFTSHFKLVRTYSEKDDIEVLQKYLESLSGKIQGSRSSGAFFEMNEPVEEYVIKAPKGTLRIFIQSDFSNGWLLWIGER